MQYFALLICFLFIFYLFWKDLKKSDGPSKAIWIPFTWMFLAGSRYVSSWLELGSLRSVEAYKEGSPVDAAVFLFLIAAGLYILSIRKMDWGRVLTQNKWVWLYFFYCGISLIWSDSPFVSFKRLIKELGNPVMVMVILTEEHPYQAIGVILKRLSFLFLPLSILIIRYFPVLGRMYHASGKPMYTGIGNDKNALGLICLMSGIYFAWNFFLNRKKDFKWRAKLKIEDIILIGMILYLIRMADSATSLACLVMSVCLFITGRMKLISQKPGRILILLMAAAILFIGLDSTLNLRDTVIASLGRDENLTSRVPIWQQLEGMATNPMVGAGFMSFWTGERMQLIWLKTQSHIIQAHNGYLEQYLNLGYIGVGFIVVIMLSGLLKARRHLYVDYPSAMLRLCFILTAALYNYTEASFYGISNMWLLLLFGVMEIGRAGNPREPTGAAILKNG